MRFDGILARSPGALSCVCPNRHVSHCLAVQDRTRADKGRGGAGLAYSPTETVNYFPVIPRPLGESPKQKEQGGRGGTKGREQGIIPPPLLFQRTLALYSYRLEVIVFRNALSRFSSLAFSTSCRVVFSTLGGAFSPFQPPNAS